MSAFPLPPSVMLPLDDARRHLRWLAMLVQSRHEHGLAIDPVLDADLERFAAALRAASSVEVPAEPIAVPKLVVLREVPQGWVALGEACIQGLAPVGERQLRKLARRGEITAGKVRGVWYADPESVKEHTWRASSPRTEVSTGRSRTAAAS